jgi:hypothetical protein
MYNIFSSENKEIESYQKEAIDGIGLLLRSDEKMKNSLMYFSMGKGKTLTAAQIIHDAEVYELIDSVIVVAPPSTHKQWDDLLKKYVAIPFKIVSHQWLGKNEATIVKNLSKTLVIVDEVHQSANRGKTLTKVVSKLISACYGAILMSGTPFRNKEERLYVVHTWLFEDVGSYERWLYLHCNTEPDRFAYYPKFLSFKVGEIEDFLKYIDDGENKRIFVEKESLVFKRTEVNLPENNHDTEVLKKYSVYGFNRIQIANSVRQKLAYLNYLKFCKYIDRGDDGEMKLIGPREDISEVIRGYADRNPIVYCFSSKISKLFFEEYGKNAFRVDGKTPKKKKEEIIARYKKEKGVMFATDSISTGTDGLQEVTDLIIILDDTMDGTNREQLIGRIAGGFRNTGNAEVVFININ